ncbi:hypothetical protein D3C84_351250 [compost metagenome]
MHVQPLGRVASRERQSAGQRLIKNRGQRVDIAARIKTGGIASHLLGGQIRPLLQAGQFNGGRLPGMAVKTQ